MDQFPMFRLVTLLARQASAPIAARIKTYASSHPWFSQRVCMATGRLYHVVELRAKMWMLALRQPRTVPPLSDAKALEDGANLLGEAVLFFLGALIVIFEVNRQANKQEYKELDIKSQWMAVLAQLEELKRELEFQQQDIDRLLGVLRLIAPGEFKREPPISPSTPTVPPQSPLTQAPRSQPPAAKSQVAQSPAAKSPAVQSPAVQSPAVQSPAVQSPAVQSSAVQSPAVHSSKGQSTTSKSSPARPPPQPPAASKPPQQCVPGCSCSPKSHS